MEDKKLECLAETLLKHCFHKGNYTEFINIVKSQMHLDVVQKFIKTHIGELLDEKDSNKKRKFDETKNSDSDNEIKMENEYNSFIAPLLINITTPEKMTILKDTTFENKEDAEEIKAVNSLLTGIWSSIKEKPNEYVLIKKVMLELKINKNEKCEVYGVPFTVEMTRREKFMSHLKTYIPKTIWKCDIVKEFGGFKKNREIFDYVICFVMNFQRTQENVKDVSEFNRLCLRDIITKTDDGDLRYWFIFSILFKNICCRVSGLPITEYLSNL
jgi:hypothetical protein